MSTRVFAVVDADGCFGDVTTVECVWPTAAEAYGYCRAGRRQTIEMPAAEVGQRVHSTDIGRVYPRVYRYDLHYRGRQIWIAYGASEDKARAEFESHFRLLDAGDRLVTRFGDAKFDERYSRSDLRLTRNLQR